MIFPFFSLFLPLLKVSNEVLGSFHHFWASLRESGRRRARDFVNFRDAPLQERVGPWKESLTIPISIAPQGVRKIRCKGKRWCPLFLLPNEGIRFLFRLIKEQAVEKGIHFSFFFREGETHFSRWLALGDRSRSSFLTARASSLGRHGEWLVIHPLIRTLSLFPFKPTHYKVKFFFLTPNVLLASVGNVECLEKKKTRIECSWSNRKVELLIWIGKKKSFHQDDSSFN